VTPGRKDADAARRDEDPTSVGAVVDLVKSYAKQETLDPLKGAGRWLGMGVAGAVTLGIGGILVTLGLLRLIQTEWDRSARGSLSWLAYVIVLVACVAGAFFAVTRIKKDRLNTPEQLPKEER